MDLPKINLDELYEKKKQHDLNTLNIYNKILGRIHNKIKLASRQSIENQFCWFVVPEVIIGVPKYDQSGCIAYIMNALEENGFNVKYFHPNTLFICWEHWVPSYVRNEIKHKTGIIINEYGEKISENTGEDEKEQPQENIEQIKNSKKYTPINSYKPSGKFVYSEDLLNKIENKIN